MKSLASTFLLLGLLATPGLAQRHIKGQSALGVSVGAVDGLPRLTALRAPGSAYMGSLDYVWYRANERYWKASASYVRKYYSVQDMVKPMVEQFWLSVDYVPRGLYTARRWLYVAPTIGAYVGYELVNRNQSELAEGIIQNKSTASIGPQLGIEAEVYLNSSLILVIGGNERFIPFSEVAQFRTTGYVGVRYCLSQ